MKREDRFFSIPQKGYYYDIQDDLDLMKEYDDMWCLITVGGRGTGKTYSCLKKCAISEQHPFGYVRRTNDEVDVMCDKEKRGTKFDLSPFKAINRDFGTEIFANKIVKGIGGFYKEVDGHPDGAPLGYIFSLNALGNIRGMDASECEYLIFDEFIPSIYAKVFHGEGDQFMDLYETINRDREHRGRPPLVAVCQANAYRLSNPLFETMELTDIVAYMKAQGHTYYVSNGVMIHLLDDNEDFIEEKSQSAIMKTMKNTQWGSMALSNDFAYDDMTCIGHTSLKRYKALAAFTYKRKTYYVYRKDSGQMYICRSKADVRIYDLTREVEQSAFYFDWVIKIKEASIQDLVLYSDYTPYNLIMNYKKFFKI